MKDAKELFHSVLQSKKAITVKLLGDSITHGVGGTGWAMTGEAQEAECSSAPRG